METVSTSDDRPMNDNNELSHSVRRAHCVLISSTDTMAVESGKHGAAPKQWEVN